MTTLFIASRNLTGRLRNAALGSFVSHDQHSSWNTFLTYRDQREGICDPARLILFYLVCSVVLLANVASRSRSTIRNRSWCLAGAAGALMAWSGLTYVRAVSSGARR